MIYCLRKYKEVNINTLDFLEIEEIKEDILITKDKYIRILKVYPINYDLKSEFEKQSIINSYKTVFKTCNFDFQILILSKKENIDININVLNDVLFNKIDILDREKFFKTKNNNKIEEKEEKINKIYNNYINFIQELNYDENITSKAFYIILYENRINIKKESFLKEYFNKKNKKIEKEDLIKNKKSYIKNLNEKEKKIISSLSKCGNTIKKIGKNEIYELFEFSKKGDINV